MGLDNVADIYIIETYKRQQQLRQTTWLTKKSQTRSSTATFNRHSWKHLRFSLLTFQPIAKKKLSKFLTIDASRLDGLTILMLYWSHHKQQQLRQTQWTEFQKSHLANYSQQSTHGVAFPKLSPFFGWKVLTERDTQNMRFANIAKNYFPNSFRIRLDRGWQNSRYLYNRDITTTLLR